MAGMGQSQSQSLSPGQAGPGRAPPIRVMATRFPNTSQNV